MDTNTDTSYIRSANLSDKKRRYLSKYIIDTAVQRLIPPSTVGESVNLTATTVGLLLTHQPLEERFHNYDYDRVSRLINGREDALLKILPSGYDYDLTDSLYYVPEGGPERAILTSELSIPGVELTGVCVFGREEMAVFLEEIQSCCARSQTAKTIDFTYIVAWLALIPPRRDYFEPVGLCLDGLDDEEHIGILRKECSLHLHSSRDIWIRHLGVDWPEYFFAQDHTWKGISESGSE